MFATTGPVCDVAEAVIAAIDTQDFANDEGVATKTQLTSPKPATSAADDTSLSMANVPQNALDVIGATLRAEPTSDATVSEAAAQVQADGDASDLSGTGAVISFPWDLQGGELAAVSGAGDDRIIVYSSATEITPFCKSDGNCAGQYYVVAIDATTGAIVPPLTGVLPGS